MKSRRLIAVLTVATLTVIMTVCACGNEDTMQDASPSSNEAVVEVTSTDAVETEDNEVVVGATETPSENEVSENVVVVEEDLDPLDENVFSSELYALPETNVYAEPSDTSDIIATLEEGTPVSILGIHHVSEFYKVSLDDNTIGYIRLVDLSEYASEEEAIDAVTDDVDAVTTEEAGDSETESTQPPADSTGTGGDTSSSSTSDNSSSSAIVTDVGDTNLSQEFWDDMASQGWVVQTGDMTEDVDEFDLNKVDSSGLSTTAVWQ